MLRKLVITSAAIAVLSGATASGAMAMPGHWGGGWGHPHRNVAFHHAAVFHNRFAFRHRAFFFRHHRHFAFIGAPVGFADECLVVKRVWTPWGWHWRRIWVCD